MSQASQRGHNEEGMQPVWVILQAVEVVTGSDPRRLVPPQACAIRVNVPLPRHGPYGQARAVGGAVPRAPGVEPPVLRGAPPIDGLGGAVRLWPRIGGGAVGPPAAPLQHHRGHRPAAGQRRPLRHAPQTWRTLPGGRRLRDLPGAVESLGPPRARAVLLPLPDRGEQAPHPRDRGQELPPRLTRRFPALGADRARVIRGNQGLGCLGTRAIAPFQRPRLGRLDHAHPQDTAPADRRRDVDLRWRSPGQLRIGDQITRQLLWRCHGGADQRRAANGPPGALPAQGSAATDGGQGSKRSPPLPQREGCCDRSGAPNHGGPDTRGAQGEDGAGRRQCHPAHEQVLCDGHVTRSPA